jgi:hypothetical protein
MRTALLPALLSALLLSACSRPDLVPTQIAFDPQNRLLVTFENQGTAEVPAGVGSLSIAIDGRSVGGYGLAGLADQSFRLPGGTLTIPTNFRLAGSNRRISVFVDSGRDIEESNEFQNTRSRTLTPPAQNGPDFIIHDLSLSPGNALRIHVRNVGPAASPAGLSVLIRVIVNETVAADLTPSLPALAASGGTVMITPAPAIAIAAGSRVRALFNTNSFTSEIDSTNGVREEILPDGPSLAPYLALLGQPRIRNNVTWQNGGGVRNYAAWSASEKDQLHQAILRLESGKPQVPAAPPALLPGNAISATDAWNIFLAHIAHALWVEHHHAVPWHLLDFTDAQLAFLLDSRKLLAFSGGKYSFSTGLMGSITAWNPRISYEFMNNLGMIGSNQLDTIYALTDWIRGHVSHTAGVDDFNVVFGYPGHPPVDKVLYAIAGQRHKSAGCWGTAGLYGAVLRGVNIPVERGNIAFHNGTHARPVLLSVNRSMPHGDDPYTTTLTPSGEIIPSSILLYTSAQMNTRFLSPALDCDSGDCNTVGEQASYNSSKDQLQAAYDTMGDGLLYKYSLYGPEYLNDSLRGISYGGGIVEFAFPFFNAGQRTTMVTAVENRIREIGDGDLESGKMIVMQRYQRYGDNK